MIRFQSCSIFQWMADRQFRILGEGQMRFADYNAESEKTIMMLPGMATTAHTCFDKVIPFLEHCHVILCELDGHYDKSPSFVSIEKTCEQIEEYIKQNHSGKLNAILGFSLGGTITVELISRNNVKFDYVILDAAFCEKMGILTPIYTAVFSWAVNRICNGKHIPAFMIEAVMGKGNERIIETFYRGTSLDTVKKECEDVYTYDVKNTIKNFGGKIVFWHGANEHYPAKTAKMLKLYLPNMQIQVFHKMGHGQMMNEHPREYAHEILKVIHIPTMPTTA